VAAGAGRVPDEVVAVRRLCLLVSAVVGLLFLAPATAQATPALPGVMASTGDSITRGFDATLFGCFLADCPADSWATGSASTVNSQYRRLLAVDPAVNGHNLNYARTGAKMNELDGQMKSAAAAGAEYVTVLMGANDLCGSTLTATADFAAQFHTALADFFAAAPAGARVYVSSIPNLQYLYDLFKSNSTATSRWRTFGICPPVLGASATPTSRAAVAARETAFNNALATECTALVWQGRCRWDGGTTFNYPFATSDVSTVDYFHPSVSGQATLARISWAQSFWAKPTV
jgi:lysophospholipase L1-like esterase